MPTLPLGSRLALGGGEDGEGHGWTAEGVGTGVQVGPQLLLGGWGPGAFLGITRTHLGEVGRGQNSRTVAESPAVTPDVILRWWLFHI